MASRSRRRFAPLKAGAAASSDLPKLKGVVFDVDGTLCQPQNYMFAQMRSALGIAPPADILDHIDALPTPAARAAAMAAVRAIERAAMAAQAPQPGLVALMAYLDARGLPKGVCTRNFNAPVAHLLAAFVYPAGVRPLRPIVTRDFRPPKPSPAGILHIARSWGLTKPGGAAADGEADGEADGGDAAEGERQVGAVVPSRAGEEGRVADASGLIMVGDSIDDMTAGRRAGAATVLLVNPENEHLAEHEHTDLVIGRLDELIGVLEEGFTGREI